MEAEGDWELVSAGGQYTSAAQVHTGGGARAARGVKGGRRRDAAAPQVQTKLGWLGPGLLA